MYFLEMFSQVEPNVCLQALCSLCCMTGESRYNIYSPGITFNVKGITKYVFFQGFVLKHPVVRKCQGLAPAVWGTDHDYITSHVTSGQLVDVNCSLRSISTWERNIHKYAAPSN